MVTPEQMYDDGFDDGYRGVDPQRDDTDYMRGYGDGLELWMMDKWRDDKNEPK